ncbi:MAG TPA: hypothetical protein PK821_06460 [Victivallales bacterium]|nr:hypothetical protein [Victivallales bacterium]
MIDDIRTMKDRIEKAKKQKALQDAKSKKTQKEKIYEKAETRIIKTQKEKEEEEIKTVRIQKAFSFLKIAAAVAIFALSGFVLHSAMKDKSGYANVSVLNTEDEADDMEAKTAERFIRKILSEIERDGIDAIREQWSPYADEESRFYAEEMLFGTNSSSLELCSVKRLPDSQLKVVCMRDSHPISFRIARHEDKMVLVSVD